MSIKLASNSSSLTATSAGGVTGHIPALDGVRGIAVLIVMLLHFTIMNPSGAFESAFVRTTTTGWIGVDLFFVLSGFLITGILYDAKGGAYFFRNFYLRRSLRIFPLYYAFLVVLFVLLPRVAPGSVGQVDGQAWIWTYLSNVHFARVGWYGMPEHTVHLWSLAIEEQFYLLWPLVVFFCDRTRLMRVAIATIVGATAFRIVALFFAPDGIAGYALLPARVDALALGGLLALQLRGETGIANARLLAKKLFVPGIALFGIAVALSIVLYPGKAFLPALEPPTQLLGYPAAALLSGSLVLMAVAGSHAGLLRRSLTWEPLIALGKYSYGLYLIHIPVRDVMRGWSQNGARLPMLFDSRLPAQLGVFVVGIGISVVIALISWHFFEKHFLKLKAYFPYDSRRVEPTIAESGVTGVADSATRARPALVTS